MTEQQAADLRGIVKKYDVRGVAGTELTEEIARALGAAFADLLDGAPIIVAHDMRVSSPTLAAAVAEGAARRGSTVAEAGLSSTDQLYCASGQHDAAGVMVTASHNPAPDNGLKLTRAGARAISRETGLEDVRRGAEAYLASGVIPEREGGRRAQLDTLEDYTALLHRLVPLGGRRRLRVVVDAADAMASLTVPAVLGSLEHLDVVPLHFGLDGTFPHHPANPLDPANLVDLHDAVLAAGADLGLAFDGDADRCVVLDEQGRPVDPSAVTALIAGREIARARAAGEERPVVVANLVSSRHVAEVIAAAGGEAVRSPVGHSLIKAIMAERSAVFGGEHSAHYYFRDFFFADSGLLAAMHVLAALEESDGPLSALVAEHQPYAASGELNTTVADPSAARERVRAALGARPGVEADDLDGLTLTHWGDDVPAAERWWLSLRSSNTEPLLRLNVEAEEAALMESVRDEVLAIVTDADTDASGGAGAVAAAGAGAGGSLPAGASGVDVPSWVRAVLRCPDCGGSLQDATAGLRCEACGRVHAVEGGIPVLIAGRAETPDGA